MEVPHENDYNAMGILRLPVVATVGADLGFHRLIEVPFLK
jgi:hypothetical protein